MKTNIIKTLLLSGIISGFAACTTTSPKDMSYDRNRYEFNDILDIRLTPDSTVSRVGCFTDAGSWMGFTLPQSDRWVNGFCGPFSIDNRIWFAQAAVEVGLSGKKDVMTPDSVSYFPGEVYMASSSAEGRIFQRMNFIDANTALLQVETDCKAGLSFTARQWNSHIRLEAERNTVTAYHPNGEIITLSFGNDITLTCDKHNYMAQTQPGCKKAVVAISFFTSEKELLANRQHIQFLLNNPKEELAQNTARWNGYLQNVLRDDMKPEYDRIAVKSVVTLISNWRTHREGLLHEGVIPSHAVGYFIGFWAWDSWRFSAALASFAPELAKNNIRAMFDYQLPDGMIIDCIYTNSAENNARDSKPPLVCWAVDKIFTHTQDTAFVKEMYPQLLAYYKWWYAKRDHNHNGICEFGSTDGTLEAAAWESGMDNAIRFDHTKMLKNAEDAWSMDQESVDLNAYLAYECRLLKKFASLAGTTFDGPDYSDKIADYFFDEQTGWFCDRRLSDGSFIEEPGCEGYTPLWVGIADQRQMDKALVLLTDTTKFSTYIPFPTIAADNPKCDSNGYWRGPIWLDQTYQAITGLRNYGYKELADQYTEQVFERCQGLQEDAPIHENYGTHDGKRLQAPHFSWSASHLLMMYENYNK